MPNPSLMIFDSDVLVQLFIADEIRPLKEIKKLYGIQPAVVQEVDIELRWLGHHKARFVPQLDKSLKVGLITRLDKTVFQSLMSAARPGASWSGFQSLGALYDGYVGKGEAYTHAAGVVLGLPTISNDFRAIQLLQSQMMNLPAPILRCFDLLAFCLESGILCIQDCESVRKCLLKSGEGVPKAFAQASFEDGLTNFRVRLRDSAENASVLRGPNAFSDPLYITRI